MYRENEKLQRMSINHNHRNCFIPIHTNTGNNFTKTCLSSNGVATAKRISRNPRNVCNQTCMFIKIARILKENFLHFDNHSVGHHRFLVGHVQFLTFISTVKTNKMVANCRSFFFKLERFSYSFKIRIKPE